MGRSAKKEESFETALEKLENIVDELETGDIALADLLAKYTQGVTLSKYCLEQLESTEKAMDLIVKEKNGQVRESALVIEGE